MRAAMGRNVYKKLRAQYGNSFHNVITHYSNTNYKEEYENGTEASRSRPLDKINLLGSKINDDLGVFGDICSSVYSRQDEVVVYTGMRDYYFLTDGNLQPGECINSSEKVQREIEHLAERITRSIIGAKGMDE